MTFVRAAAFSNNILRTDVTSLFASVWAGVAWWRTVAGVICICGATAFGTGLRALTRRIRALELYVCGSIWLLAVYCSLAERAAGDIRHMCLPAAPLPAFSSAPVCTWRALLLSRSWRGDWRMPFLLTLAAFVRGVCAADGCVLALAQAPAAANYHSSRILLVNRHQPLGSLSVSVSDISTCLRDDGT